MLRVGGEDAGEALAEHGVIVGEQDPDRAGLVEFSLIVGAPLGALAGILAPSSTYRTSVCTGVRGKN